MEQLIEALQIFLKYDDDERPTCCEHDALYVLVDPQLVSKEDIERLSQLSFVPNAVGGFTSFYYGSS